MEQKKIEALKEGDVLKNKRTKEYTKYLGDYNSDEKKLYGQFRSFEYNLGFHIISKKDLLNFFESNNNQLIVYN